MIKTSTEKRNGLASMKVLSDQFEYLDDQKPNLTIEETVDEALRLQNTVKPLNDHLKKLKDSIKSESNDFIEGSEAVATIKHKTLKKFDNNKIEKLCNSLKKLDINIDIDDLKTETNYRSLSITSK
jgi:hypothetical protein